MLECVTVPWRNGDSHVSTTPLQAPTIPPRRETRRAATRHEICTPSRLGYTPSVTAAAACRTWLGGQTGPGWESGPGNWTGGCGHSDSRFEPEPEPKNHHGDPASAPLRRRRVAVLAGKQSYLVARRAVLRPRSVRPACSSSNQKHAGARGRVPPRSPPGIALAVAQLQFAAGRARQHGSARSSRPRVRNEMANAEARHAGRRRRFASGRAAYRAQRAETLRTNVTSCSCGSAKEACSRQRRNISSVRSCNPYSGVGVAAMAEHHEVAAGGRRPAARRGCPARAVCTVLQVI